jgi:NRPS condensation-like uncharacterized protein
MATKRKEEQEVAQVSVKNAPAGIIQKLQVIAGLENVPFNDVYLKAFETYIGLYEQKNGKIKIKPKGGGLDVI